MKRSKLILLTATALCSAFLLAACSSKPSTKVNSSSTSQTSQISKTSSSGESSTKPSAKQSSASNEAKASSSTPQTSSDQSISSQAEKPVENKISADSNTLTTSGIDVNALANGDFSSIAGTWQDDLGNQLVFDANGLVTLQRNNGETLNHNVIYNGHVEGDKFRADFGYNGAGSSDPLFAVPVGVALPLNGAPTPKEQIMLGSDAISSAQHPYYRVAN